MAEALIVMATGLKIKNSVFFSHATRLKPGEFTNLCIGHRPLRRGGVGECYRRPADGDMAYVYACRSSGGDMHLCLCTFKHWRRFDGDTDSLLFMFQRRWSHGLAFERV